MAAIWSETAMMPKMPSTWIVVGYLIVFGSIGVFVLTLYVLARRTASATLYSLLLIPIVPMLLGAWLAHATTTLGFLIGGVIVLAGVYSGAVAPPELFSRLRMRTRDN
jgi:drug/metabolite transporter (DMT)-like permease